MSTKIYNGYKINSTNFNEILKELKRLSFLMKEEQVKHAIKIFLRIFASIVDASNLKITAPKYKGSNYYEIWDEIEKEMIQSANSISKENIFFDLRSEVVLIPKNDYTLALFYSYGLTKETTKIWQKSPLVQEYAYWDNTDQPDGVSDQEWLERSQAWDFLGVPSDEGFIFELTPKIPPYDFLTSMLNSLDLYEDILSVENRLLDKVEYFLEDMALKEVSKDMVVNTFNAMDIRSKAIELLKSDLYQNKKIDLIRSLRPTISPIDKEFIRKFRR